ncbi:GNAT family N-acetyltransferase [bacterium]|nr:GNAT family N-acetyltransferase [bacterium]
MNRIYLRKLNKTDIRYFSKWWRDKDLISLTSGNFELMSDKQIEDYFADMLASKTSFHFIITVNKETIGHISISKKRSDWYELQTVIGEKVFLGKGYGTKAIKLITRKAKTLGIGKIYLEVRPDNLRAIKTYEKSGFVFSKMKYYPKNDNLPKTMRMELKLF